MDNILNLNKSAALNLITALIEELSAADKLEYALCAELSTNASKTYTDMNTFAVSVCIGISEIVDTKASIVSDADFVNVIMSIYHAHMHCVQKNNVFRKADVNEFEKTQIIQEIACFGNFDYYLSNYSSNLNEIQAEQYCIAQGHQYLLDIFPDIDAIQIESLLLEAVNIRRVNLVRSILADMRSILA